MSLQEILDSLLTSARTGPLITATRHFQAKPAVYAPFPSSLDPRLVEALRSRGVPQLYSHQARAFETVAKGENHVGAPLSTPPLRRPRRAPRLSRRFWEPSRQCAAAAQAHLPSLWLLAPVHHGLRDHRQPARAR